MKKILIAFFLIISFNLFSFPKIDDVLNGIDEITRLNTDGSAKVSIYQKKEGQGIKKYESIYYRRDSDNSFLILMTAPDVEKGNGYLRVGDNFWMYRRNTRTFQHVNRDESIAGTDSKAEDFENKKMIEMYEGVKDENGNEKINEEKLGDIPVYKFEVKAKISDVSYPKKIYWVRKDNFVPLKEESYSLSGTLMQTAYFPKYTTIQGKYLWIKGIFVDEFEKGNRTVVDVEDISINKLDDFIFTKAYLENLSK